MQAETWQRVSTVVARALERPAAERQRFLDQACSDDPRVRREAEVLLAFDTEALDAADRPVFELFPQQAEPASMDPRQVGPYEIVGELGRGGMSDVFSARRIDGLPPAEVAVKVLKRGLEAADGPSRLYREGEILGRLRHPHIAAVFGGGITDDGRPFLIIERVLGVPIDAYCKNHRVDLEGRLRLFLDVCEAVAYAHRNLVIHRDLKPSNILVSDEGQVKLLDFGISKLLDPRTERSAPVTATDLRVMTPEFASPEQVRGEPVSIASDVHSLGVVLFQLLTGRLPFLPSSVESLLHQVCFEDAPRASAALGTDALDRLGPPAGGSLESWRRRLRGDLDTILAMALRKEPERRYASASELADDLRNYLELRPIEARSGDVAYRLRKALRRHRWPVSILVVFVTVVTALMVDRVGVYRQLQQESRRALATQDFLLELFDHADPDSGNDGDLTVREVLDSGVERLDRLREQPHLQGHLLTTVGHIYANLGRGQEAEALARKSLEIHLETVGAVSREAADSRRLLGRVLSENGALAEADSHLRQAIELYDGPFPAPSAMVEAMTTLAFNLQQQGDSDQALTVIRSCLDRCRQEGLEDSSEMAVAVNNLGFILHGRGESEAAAEAFERAVVLYRRLHGEDHPMVALAYSNLGAIAIMEDDPETAIERFEAALGIWQRTVGEEDRLVFTAHFNLAALHFRTEHYDQAIDSLETLLPKMVNGLGAKHPLVGEGMALLAKSLAARGGHEPRVSDLRRRVLELYLEIYGASHPKTATAYYQRALDVRGTDPEQAISWLRQAVGIEEQNLGPDDPQTAGTRALLEELLANRTHEGSPAEPVR